MEREGKNKEKTADGEQGEYKCYRKKHRKMRNHYNTCGLVVKFLLLATEQFICKETSIHMFSFMKKEKCKETIQLYELPLSTRSLAKEVIVYSNLRNLQFGTLKAYIRCHLSEFKYI